MGARRTVEGVESVYEAAQKWVACALRADDSLFTPGVPIWSSRWLGELRERFLDRPDMGSGTFYGKVKQQLEGSPPKVYQLMAEALYVHFLIIASGNLRGDTKQDRINEVIGWSGQQLEIPSELAAGLARGIAGIGANRSRSFPFMVGFLIEFVDQYKQLEPEKRRRLLEDPWEFKVFAAGLDLRGALFGESRNLHRPQQEALLHLVFPDTFERIVSFNQKRQIAAAKAFAHFIAEGTEDVDRKLAQIRQGLEADLGSDFDFYDDDLYRRWNPLASPNDDDPSETDDTTQPLPSLEALAEQLFFPVEFLEEIEALLDDKKQVIFQGPPGTGKTYVAQKLARHLAGSEERVTLVQLHPSYAYEDFVQGFRPILKDGQAGFALRDGPLLRAAKLARSDSNNKHFLVIDEINRGNLAKVLGELYFLLEYRDERIRLQYQREDEEDFTLPDNLYIIGTMNTADRSIALVDLALRRRFYFVEFHPDDEPVKDVLHDWLADKSPDMEWVADVVERANELMREDRHAAIGPSYFMKDDLNEEAVRRIWKHSVLPYIEERRFGESDSLGEFDLDKLMDRVVPVDCIVDGMSRLVGISKEEAERLIEAEGGVTQADISNRWGIWHAAFKAAGLKRASFPRDERPTLEQVAQSTPAFIARVRTHLVTVVNGEAFEACDNRTDMDRKPNHYWIRDDSGNE